HTSGMPPLIEPPHAIAIFLDAERPELHRRIDARFDAMLHAGALEEVRALDARRLDPLSPVLKAHGVPWLRKVLAGEMTLHQATPPPTPHTTPFPNPPPPQFPH